MDDLLLGIHPDCYARHAGKGRYSVGKSAVCNNDLNSLSPVLAHLVLFLHLFAVLLLLLEVVGGDVVLVADPVVAQNSGCTF